MSGQKPREIAARVLDRAAFPAGPWRGQFVEDLLEEALSRTRLSSVDRRLCQELVYGVVRWSSTLDFLIDRKTRGRTQKAPLRNFLRLGLYQLFWLERIPSHAAVHETVELAKRAGFGPKAGFINAMLREYVREVESTKRLLGNLKAQRPELGFSHPQWLVERWQLRWGMDKATSLMEWNNTPPRLFARVNGLKTDAGKLLAAWHEENVRYDFVRRDWFEENVMFELKAHPPLADLRTFQQGWFYVQDPGTLLAVRALAPKPGEAVLDMCAAPGGKLSYIAEWMENEGKLVAHDLSEDRLRLVRQNCARLGLDNVQTALEGTLLMQRPLKFDRILVDAPCSNTGVMRRRVDLRWRLQREEIQRLRGTQLELLRRAAGLIKRGGIIVYSTCSVETEENHEVVEQFLHEQNRLSLQHERELIPFVDKVDGAYVAQLTSW